MWSYIIFKVRKQALVIILQNCNEIKLKVILFYKVHPSFYFIS